MSQDASATEDLTLPWHDNLWQQVVQARRVDRLAHGLLVCGPPGVGKHRLAERLAQALLCHEPGADGDACGHCSGCLQRAGGAHPDISILKPEEEGKVIRVDQMRRFTRRLQLTPQYETGRLGWLESAEQLNTAAANSLLKTLEEPPAGTHLILISNYADRLLPTIRSRCRILRVPPVPVEQARDWLNGHGVQTNDANSNTLHMPLRLLARSDDASQEMEQGWRQDLAKLLLERADAVPLAERWADQPSELLIDWLYRTVCALMEYRLTGRGLYDKTLEQCAPHINMQTLEHMAAWTARAAYLKKTNANWQYVIESVLSSNQSLRYR